MKKKISVNNEPFELYLSEKKIHERVKQLGKKLNGDYKRISAAPPGNIYTWTVTGGTIVSGQGTHSIIVRWTSPGNASVTVHETNGFCQSVDQSLNVTVNPNPPPTTIFGNTNVCANSTQTYSIAADP